MTRSAAFEPGAIFGGEFRIVRPLSEGGMGAVYVVEQASTGSLRALKVMHDHLLSDEKSRRRFVQEARVSSQIRSEHVVQVLSAGIDSGMPWLVMELLEGQDLAGWVRAAGPLSLSQVHEIFLQLCHALDAAHRVGIVHRDLKPENVFLAHAHRAGDPFVVKVLDFGIAKILSDASSSSSTTSAIGTPLWMAPEQTDAGAPIVAGTDVWSLGLIVFWMLTGRCFWKAARAEQPSAMVLMREIVFEPLPCASQRALELGVAMQLPAGFDAWFARCVCRDPQARYRNGGEARDGWLELLSAGATAQTNVSTAPGFVDVGESAAASTLSCDFITAKTVLASPSLVSSPQATTEASTALSESIPPPSALVVRGGRARVRYILAAGGVLCLSLLAYALFKPRETPESMTRDCEAGRVNSCLKLAKAFDHGAPGFARSSSKSLQFYQKACELDDANSCLYLATIHQMGESVSRDDSRAAHFFERACFGGVGLACRSLGSMYMRGGAIPKNERKAAHFLVRACELGQAEACSRAGELYRDGLGVPVEPDKAQELFARGCFGKDPAGCRAMQKR